MRKLTVLITATNRVKVSMALQILRDVLPGEGFGISDDVASHLTGMLRDAEIKLFESYQCAPSTETT